MIALGRRVWRVTLLVVLLTTASIPLKDSLAQANADLMARFAGTYSGALSRSVTASMGSQVPAPNDDTTAREKQDLQQFMRNSEMALRDHRRDQPVAVQLSISPASDHWIIELRHAEQQGVPLPTVVVVSIPKELTPLSPVNVEGLPPELWMVRASFGAESLTVYLFERDSLATPVQMQVSLQPVGQNIRFVLWRIDRDGHRATAWAATLVRQER
jgi:hypothetical protein